MVLGDPAPTFVLLAAGPSIRICLVSMSIHFVKYVDKLSRILDLREILGKIS